jgi:protein-L-isoaspartate O-methyltransferase
MSDQATREKAYWDETYRAEGLNHEKYLWSTFITESSYGDEFFNELLGRTSRRKVLTIGGGVDTLGISLAKNDNRVVSLDISHEASRQTRELARQLGVEKNLSAVSMNCEEMVFDEKFDVVVCKRALHHMKVPMVIERVHDSLIEGGSFIAEEPVCLLKPLRWIHEKLPIHPSPRTKDEVEFTEEDLAFIAGAFREVKFHYIDFLTRESIKYYLWKAGAAGLLRPLGRFDFSLVNKYLAPLKYLSTYTVIQAVK